MDIHASPRPDTSTGPKRVNPFDDPIPVKRQRQEAQLPVDLLKDWLSAVERLPLQETNEVEEFLSGVALGAPFPHDPGTPQLVFNELIRCEAYDVFVAVFAAYHEIQRASAPDGAAPAASRLILQLPHDWVPAAPARMVQAFTQVQAQRVVVFPPPSDDDAYYLVPDAVHDCLVALLESETTALVELVINGPMRNPTGLADAFEDSKLQSVEFGWMDDTDPPDPQDLACYETLTAGLANCRTLTHIGITHPQLFSIHTAIAPFLSNGPQLASVSFHLGAEQPVARVRRADGMQIRDFMQAVNQFETLTTVKGNASMADGESLTAAFIEPLTGHQALTHLEVEGGMNLPTDSATLAVLPMVASLSVSCPSLTHFKWSEGPLRLEAGDNMRAFIQAGGDLDMPEASNALAMAMAGPAFHLRSFTFGSVPLGTGVLNAFFAALKTNKTLSHVDLSDCHIDLRSTLILMDSLESNTTLETIVLPDQYDDYYLRTSDGHVYGFLRNEPDSDDDEDDPEGFTLVFPEGVSDESRALAFAEFAELESHANRLFAALRARNLRTQGAIAQGGATRAFEAAQIAASTTTTATATTTTTTTTTATTTTTGTTYTATTPTTHTEPVALFMSGVDLSPFVPEPENKATGTPGLALFTPETPGEPNSPKG